MVSTSRRSVIAGLGAAAAASALSGGKVWAQPAGSGLLARLREAKKIRVGLANQPPFSGLNPDGSLTGIAPSLAKVILGRLGIPEIEGVIATYGELIPGMQAGRWDFVSASLTITKQRCAEVLFSDPIAFDGGAIVSLKGELANPPKLVADLVREKTVIGVQQGGAHSRFALSAGVQPENMRQFPNDTSTIDALVAKRIQVAFGSNSALRHAYTQRNLDVVVTYPVADDPPPGSASAFRKSDTDLYEAYQKELRAMKASGEYLKIAHQFGFDTPPDLMKLTSDEMCARES